MPGAGSNSLRHFGKLADGAGLLVLFGLEMLLSWDKAAAPFPGGAWLVPWLVAVLYVPLAFRRVRPAAVFGLTVTGSSLMSVMVPGFVPLFCVWLALYTVARMCPRREAVAAVVLACVPVLLNVLVEVGRDSAAAQWDVALVGAVGGAVITLAVFGLGRWVAWSVEQRRRVAAFAAERAIRDERSRIARELHDVVAHAVSLMVLQSAGAAKVLDTNPRQAAAAMESVSTLGQQAVVELRRMLGLLYDDGPGSAYGSGPGSGMPGLSRLQVLLDEAARAGLDVDLHVTGQPVPLEPGVDLSAYRVVQEALTNAARYGEAGQRASVSLDWGPSGITLEVRNRCAERLPGDHPLSTGHGLLGMAERARAAHGWVEPVRDGSDFVVRAGFPAVAPSQTGIRSAPVRHGR
ncbi:histidine kinase [Pseudarthrobacter sp. J75]|nr:MULTISPECIES: histidine kinase [unclassified Pseudarthrobacter]MEE2522966.1 histidine kinase [Pseudarthrobacter sp. J47]MEE2529440.1 histidine kinase [Pseudarthrobacter sp. J75]MEE2568642.1 histidine kinase [Pseudarthrobacter sp. J64]